MAIPRRPIATTPKPQAPAKAKPALVVRKTSAVGRTELAPTSINEKPFPRPGLAVVKKTMQCQLARVDYTIMEGDTVRIIGPHPSDTWLTNLRSGLSIRLPAEMLREHCEPI